MIIDGWECMKWGRWNKERLELGSRFSTYAMKTRCTDGWDLTKALDRSGAARVSAVASMRVLAECKRLHVKTFLCEVGKIKSIVRW